MILTCPNVRAKALGRYVFEDKKGKEKKGITEFFGARVEAGFIISAQAALFANKRGGLCVITGLGVNAFGAAIQGARMTIRECKKPRSSFGDQTCKNI